MNVLPLRTADTLSAKTNFPGLDAIRALAALGVVLLHSCVPYLRHPMPGLAWPVHDKTSSVVDFAFWSIELFIMPLFLVMAGFFAWQTLRRRGEIALVKSRAKRLLFPLLFGIIVVLPLDLYCWVLGWVAEGIVAPVKLKSLKFDAALDRDLWGLSHLWFLQYLFLYVVVVAAASRLIDRFGSLRKRIQFDPRTIVALVFLIATVTLYVRPEVVWGFQHSFAPVPSKWIYSGLFFALGCAIAAHDGQLNWLKTNARRLAAPAIALAVVSVVLGRWHLSGGDSQLAEVTLAGFTSASAMLLSLCIIGIAVDRINRVSTTLRYLAAASFWVYMLHHPIVGLVHLDLKWLLPDLNPIVKTVAAFGIATSVSLLTYEGLVRRTWLGRMLGFQLQLPGAVDPTTARQQTDLMSIHSLKPSDTDESSSDQPRRAA